MTSTDDKIKFVDLSQDDLSGYVDEIINRADAYILSEFNCLCGGRHVMLWPAERDEADYNKFHKLTHLPICPTRLWRSSAGLRESKKLYQFISEVKQGGKSIRDL